MKPVVIAALVGFYTLQMNASNPTFSEDLELLEGKINDLTILTNGDSQIAVSPSFQGRIFTSTAKGNAGLSLGWFNREVIQANDQLEQNLSGFGGESRLWFGPQFGDYSTFHNDIGSEVIEISPDMANRLFETIDVNKHSITCGNTMQIRNASGYIFKFDVARKIALLNPNQISAQLGIDLPFNLSSVAYTAETKIKNLNEKQWNQAKGLISIWELSCMIPSPNTVAMVPTQGKWDDTVIYFTEIDEKRLKLENNTLIYKTDASYMNKIGLPPQYSQDVFGSYNPEANLLTIVKFSLNKDGNYVNSHPDQPELFNGCAIDIFNGEVNPAEDRNWPFFELETSSDTYELKPDETMQHIQTIFHFVGDIDTLNPIAQTVLGVNLNDAVSIF